MHGTAQHSTVVTSLGGVEGVGGGDPLYVGGEGGVGEDVAPPVDSLHTPAQAHPAAASVTSVDSITS